MVLRKLALVVLAALTAPSSAFVAQHVQASSCVTTSADERTTQLFQSKQAEYGTSIDLPGSYVKCGKCQTCFAVAAEDLGNGRGRRLGCSVCGHSWFQSKDRLMTVRDGFELIDLPDRDKERIELNKKEGKSPGFMGDAKLYVGNIAFECHEDDLFRLFEGVGEVGEVSLVRDNEGKNRGFGFVTMRTKDGGQKAMDELNGANVRGRNIAVRESTN